MACTGEGEVSDGSLHARSEVAYENCHKLLKKCVPYSEYLGPNAFQMFSD